MLGSASVDNMIVMTGYGTEGQVRTQRRTRGAALVALALFALSVCAAVAGFLLTAVSACCGSRDPSNPTYAIAGLVVAGALLVAGIGLWRRAVRHALLEQAQTGPSSLCSPR